MCDTSTALCKRFADSQTAVGLEVWLVHVTIALILLLRSLLLTVSRRSLESYEFVPAFAFSSLMFSRVEPNYQPDPGYQLDPNYQLLPTLFFFRRDEGTNVDAKSDEALTLQNVLADKGLQFSPNNPH